MKKLFNQFLRFAGVGTTAFIIDYATMLFLAEVFDTNYLVASTVGFIVSTVFNYIASFRFVFVHREDISYDMQFMIFFLLSLIGLLLNGVLMYIGVDIFSIDYRIMKVLATMIVTVYNFITRKVFLDAKPEQAQ